MFTRQSPDIHAHSDRKPVVTPNHVQGMPLRNTR